MSKEFLEILGEFKDVCEMMETIMFTGVALTLALVLFLKLRIVAWSAVFAFPFVVIEISSNIYENWWNRILLARRTPADEEWVTYHDSHVAMFELIFKIFLCIIFLIVCGFARWAWVSYRGRRKHTENFEHIEDKELKT